MTHNIEEGDEIIEAPGSTHSRTWEVDAVYMDGDVTLALVEKAVGYVTGDVTLTVDGDRLEDYVDGDVLPVGAIEKVAPDWEEKLR